MAKQPKKATPDFTIAPGATQTITVAASMPDPVKVTKVQELLGFTPADGNVSDALLDSLIKTLAPPKVAKPMPGSALKPGDTAKLMEGRLGVPLPFLREYFQWGDAAKIKAQLADDAAHGRISYISIKPPNNSWTTWPQVADPKNAQYAAIADALHANPLGAYVSFHHEPENDRAEVAKTGSGPNGTNPSYIGDAAAQAHRDTFKKAFRTFVTVLRPLVPANVEVGVFTPMDYTLMPQGRAKWGDLDLWNPGDDVVGVMGMDCYNGQPGLDATLAYAKRHGKQLVVGECGVAPTADQVGWLKTLDGWARTNADTVLGWCWWNGPGFVLTAAAEAELASLIRAYTG